MIDSSQWDSMILYMRMVLGGYKGRYSFRNRQTHSLRVTQWAQRIWNEDGQNANHDVLIAAAILHDIGYSAKGGEDHGEIGAMLAGQYLYHEGFPEEFTEKVSRCIRLHSRKEWLRQPEKAEEELSPELRMLMEADLLDECGAMAIIWDCMAEGQEDNQSFEKTYQRILKNSPDFLECNWMISPSARCYWEERQALLRDFLEESRMELFLDEKMPAEYEKTEQYMQKTMKGHTLTPNRQGVIYPFRQRDDHMLRVFFQARRLFKNEKTRQKDLKQELTPYARRVLSYAALLHDIGYRKTDDGYLHASVGAQMALEYLRDQNLPEELCNDVAELIRQHADKSLLERKDVPLLLRLLMEADHQDESGALSIMWDAMASSSQPDPLGEQDYDSALQRIQRYTVRMFERCEYQTASGKECWNQKGRFVEQFVQSFLFDLKEWSSTEENQ